MNCSVCGRALTQFDIGFYKKLADEDAGVLDLQVFQL